MSSGEQKHRRFSDMKPLDVVMLMGMFLSHHNMMIAKFFSLNELREETKSCLQEEIQSVFEDVP